MEELIQSHIQSLDVCIATKAGRLLGTKVQVLLRWSGVLTLMGKFVLGHCRGEVGGLVLGHCRGEAGGLVLGHCRGEAGGLVLGHCRGEAGGLVLGHCREGSSRVTAEKVCSKSPLEAWHERLPGSLLRYL